MATALSIFGVAFAAFCIWLTVRIVNRRERWAKWTLTMAAGLPMLYVASFGPSVWIVSRQYDFTQDPNWREPPWLNRIYWLLARAMSAENAVDSALTFYARLAAPEDLIVFVWRGRVVFFTSLILPD